MLSNYFTLAALAREWSPVLSGSIVRDVYSPVKDELTIELERDGDVQAVRVSVRPGFHFVYRTERSGRPRSNVATLLEDAIGSRVKAIEMNPTDRIVSIILADERRLDMHLYGARANVFLVHRKDGEERIDDAFKRSDRYAGDSPPIAKALPDGDLRSELTGDTGTPIEKRIARLRPRFGRVLIREILHRGGVDLGYSNALSEEGVDRVFGVVEMVQAELVESSPRIYRLPDDEIFSLVRLEHLRAADEETFASVDEAIRKVVGRRTRVSRLQSERQPLLKALERALEKTRKKAVDLERAASTASRSDEYERWGHLLMANPRAQISGDALRVQDILGGGDEIAIPVKPDLSVIENAERYYAKARDIRTERATLDERIDEAKNDLRSLMRLLGELASTDDPREVERFRKVNAASLRRYVGSRAEGAPAPVPFRRFRISGDFEVLVGRNARENDKLTFDHASPHDLWLHARGVAGSHVVLRVPGKKTVVGKPVKAEAAAIAAWFSAARGSKLVPVIITERKYVSKPKGTDPGAVRVLREEVIIVEPALPGNAKR